MQDFLGSRANAALRPVDEAALQALNDRTVRYGLSLSPADAAALFSRRAAALSETGRVEFSGGILTSLADAFCDSPYLEQDEYAAVLGELTDAFYALKNETHDLVTDDELLSLMRARFDKTGGAAEAVADIPIALLLGSRSVSELYGDGPGMTSDEDSGSGEEDL